MAAPTTLNVSNPRGQGYHFALDQRLFRIVTGAGRDLTIETAPQEASRVNTASSPEEFTPESGLIFSRSQFDGGEGLFRAHTEGADPSRFWDSKNVSVTPAAPGEFPDISLLYTTALIDPLTNVEPRMAYSVEGTSLYVTAGNLLRRSDNPEDASPTFVDEDPHAGKAAETVNGVVTLGSDIYAALGTNGIHKKTGGVWAEWNTVQAFRIWSVKGRIVASDGQALYEVLTSGAPPAATLTLPPGKEWVDVVDGGSHVLAAATDGYVYAFESQDGILVLTSQTHFEGETPSAVGHAQGVVSVGTSGSNGGRFYVGVLADSGQVVDLRLVKGWTDGVPRVIAGHRTAAVTAVQDGADTYLWRFDLATGGMSRYLTVAAVNAEVHGLLFLGGKWFASLSESGVWRETSTYSSEGYLIGPLGDFFNAADKSWVSASLETGPLTSGMTVELLRTSDPEALQDPESESWVRVIERTTGTGNPGSVAMTPVVSRFLAGQVRLTPTVDAASTPTVRALSFLAYPSTGDEELIINIPVNVSDQLERRGKARKRVKGLGERTYKALMFYEGRPVSLQLYAPELTVRGYVEYIGTPVPAQTKRGSSTWVSMVRVRGRLLALGGETFGTGAFGTSSGFATPPTFGTLDAT